MWTRYNNELVKCLEDLREKREQVNKAILKEEKEKGAIQKQVRCVSGRGKSFLRGRGGCRASCP